MTEKHLLFAVLAFESDLIDLAQLTAACRAWVADKSKPIADLLVERGWITAEDRGFVEKQLARKLAKHQHDPRVTLNSVVRGDVCDAIKQVEDADIQQSLSSWPSSGPVLIETIGETLGEPEQPKSRYTWLSEVGKGGLGKVWLARDNDLAREVALKEVKPGSASTEAVRRLIKEAQITGQLQHPNIVPVYEVNRGGRPFYTMKLVKGETLSKAIRRHHEQSRAGHEDPLSLPRLLNVFVNVCEALAYAHSRGIIHRDLKPENIVLGDYGEAIVLDWGLAKQIGSADEETAPVLLTEDALSQATRQGATPGTPAYMSPEQAAGRVDLLDQRTDIYGLGTILFEILTGQAPHRAVPNNQASGAASAPRSGVDCASNADSAKDRGADAAPLAKISPIHALLALLRRISEGPSPRARDVDPTISRELDAVCATAMSKKRDERYLDAKALAADVKRSLAHQPVSVYRTGAWERLRLWRRRNPVVASLSLFLAVSLLTGSVVSTLFGLAANREAKRANTEASNANRERTKAVKLSKANAALAEQEKSARDKAVLNAERANAKTDEARRHLYSARMNLAQRDWEIPQVGLVLDLLEKTRPQPGEMDIRGFEWHYWDRLCHSSLLNLTGHTIRVTSVAFSADGKRLASASLDKTVKVWDVTNGQELLTLKGQTGDFTSVAFSADGKRLAAGCLRRMVKVWDAMSGQEILTLTGHTMRVDSVAFSPDGKRLASASLDKTVKVWDATTGQEMLTLKGHTGDVTSVVFSPDGKRLASVSRDNTVKVWDVTSGQETLTLKGHSSLNSVAFSPDGTRLASASFDQTVKVWDATSGQETLALKGHTDDVTSVAFSPDGKRLASASWDQTVKVWDATSGQEVFTLKGHTDQVLGVAFSADGKRLASASQDRTVKVWDAASGQEPLTLKEQTKSIMSVAFSADGKRLASASGHPFERGTGTPGEVKLWDATSGQATLSLKGHTDGVNSVAFSADGKRLASASQDKTVKVWDTTSGQETLTLKGHSGPVSSVAFSPDGKRLASASGEIYMQISNNMFVPVDSPSEIKLWDVTSGQEALTLKGHTSGVNSVVFSADGKWLASAGGSPDEADGSRVQILKVWDATTGQETLTLKGHTGHVTSVTFSTDGKRLASASQDKTVKVWDATSGQEMLTLKGHNNVVMSVAFSADGKRLASASGDETVKLWDATSGQEMLTLRGHSEYGNYVTSVAFSADGRRLVSASLDGTIKVWDARPWTPELRAEREALSLIHWLRDQDKPQSEWLAAIAADQTLTEPVRQRALQFAREWK